MLRAAVVSAVTLCVLVLSLYEVYGSEAYFYYAILQCRVGGRGDKDVAMH